MSSPKIPLDFRKFKHISSNEHTTTLQHPKDGHTITLVHKALSPANQEQLKALSKIPVQAKQADDRGEAKQDQERIEAMADGGKVAGEKKIKHGDVSHKRDNTTIIAPTAKEGVNDANELRKNKRPEHGAVIQIPGSEEKMGKVKMLAEGGADEDAPDAVAPEALQPSPTPEQEAQAQLQDATSYDPNMPIPDDNKYYRDMVDKKMNAPQPFLNNEMPDFSVDTRPKYEQVLDQVVQQKKNDAADKDNEETYPAEQKKAIQDEQDKQTAANEASLGIQQPQAPMAEQPGAAQAQAVANPADQPSQGLAQGLQPQQQGMPDIYGLANNAYIHGIGSINGMAGVNERQGQADQALMAHQIKQDQAIQDHYQTEGSRIMQEREALKQDIADGHIDPEKFWTGYKAADGTQVGGHSKVMSAIGMILAGFNPTNQPNAAINFLKYQMDQSLEAQKQNLGAKQNLLRANLDEYHNLTDATNATRLQMNDMMQHQLGQAAATAKTEGARYAALGAKAEFEKAAIPLAQTLQLRRALTNLTNDPNKPFGTNGRALQQMRMIDPKAAAEYEQKYYPAEDTFSTKTIPADAIQKLDAHRQLSADIKDLYSWVNSHSTKLPVGPEYEVGQQKALALQAAVREGMLGTVYREGEQPLLDKFVNSNPAGVFKMMKTNPQLQTLFQGNDRAYNTLKESVGLPVKQQAPLNSGEIKTMHGAQYQRGPNGWHKVK